MWETEPTGEFERRLKEYQKNRPRELTATLDNLDTFLRALKAGAKPQNIVFGFVHPEPSGVKAIDQRGSRGSGKLAVTRLYVYPEEEAQTLHLLTIGDKKSQSDDIQACKRFVANLRKNAEQRKQTDRPDQDKPSGEKDQASDGQETIRERRRDGARVVR